MAWTRARIGAWPLALAVVAVMLRAPAAWAGQDEVDPGLVASLQALAAKDLRVATVAYRLQTAGFNHCARRTRLSGLLIQDVSQYRADLRPAASAVFKLQRGVAVTGIVAGGPGAKAGVAVGDEIMSVNGASIIAGLAGNIGARAGSDRYTAIIDRLDAAYRKGPVTLGLRRNGAPISRMVTGAPACASDVQLDLAARRNAGADGKTVTISQGLLDFVRNDDELAFVIGHELAHNILGHRDFLDSTRTSRNGLFAGLGGNGARVRETEREADYFGLYLVAWAGYDYHAAAGFWQHMGAADPLASLFPDGTHPGNGERVRQLRREAAEIDTKLAAGQPLMPDYKALIARR